MNIINVINPYPHAGTWVFDDESRGLKAEPFIFGIPEIIDKTIQLALNITERKPFKLIFSETVLPQYHLKIEKIKTPTNAGAWYKVTDGYKSLIDMEGWLCPATLKYFDDYPNELYLWVEELDSRQIPTKR